MASSQDIRAYQVSVGFYPSWGQDKKVIGCYTHQRLADNVSSLCLELFYNRIKGGVDHFIDEISARKGLAYALNHQAVLLESDFNPKKIADRVQALINHAGDLREKAEENSASSSAQKLTAYQVSVGFYPSWGQGKKVIGCYAHPGLAERVSSLCIKLFHNRVSWGTDHYLDPYRTKQSHGMVYTLDGKPAPLEMAFNQEKILKRIECLIKEAESQNVLEKPKRTAESEARIKTIAKKREKAPVENDSDPDEPSQSIFQAEKSEIKVAASGNITILEFLQELNRSSEKQQPSASHDETHPE